MFYFVKTPAFLKRWFSHLVWDVPSEEKVLYLTFDDGPTPEVTAWVLEELDKFNAKATFFCLGKNIAQFSSIYHDILKRGHRVGNHTNRHLNCWKVRSSCYIKDVCRAQETIESYSGGFDVVAQGKKLFRPPYGKITRKVSKLLRKKGYEVIMWDVLSADFDRKISNERCLANVLNYAKSGSIVVMHDSLKAKSKMQATLPKILEYFSEKGYEFKTL